jgi:translation initiation factor 2 gamma subunit (eIF-2gamma)
MKLLKAHKDFIKPINLKDLKLNEKVLIKSAVATGWAKVGTVTKIMKSQIEVTVTNVIPTIDSNKFGIKNHFKNRWIGFFEEWADMKRFNKGKKRKFFIESNVEVGCSQDWNPQSVSVII